LAVRTRVAPLVLPALALRAGAIRAANQVAAGRAIGRCTDAIGHDTPHLVIVDPDTSGPPERTVNRMARSDTTGTRLLHVVCTPRGLASNTARVSSALLESLRDEDDGLDVTTLDLFHADLPSVAGRNIESKYRLMTGQALDEPARESWSQIERAIEQFLDSDVYLLTVPMWNLGIPYVLKYYIDAIVQPGYLFRYTPEGQVEPLVRGKKMIVVISSGSDYSDELMAGFNFVEPYLRAIFGFVGITDVTVFHAQAMDVSPVLRKAGQKSAIEQVREYARSGAWRPEAAVQQAEAARAVERAAALVA
jgi:FMN-dependent NADH-azoreductase